MVLSSCFASSFSRFVTRTSVSSSSINSFYAATGSGGGMRIRTTDYRRSAGLPGLGIVSTVAAFSCYYSDDRSLFATGMGTTLLGTAYFGA